MSNTRCRSSNSSSSLLLSHRFRHFSIAKFIAQSEGREWDRLCSRIVRHRDISSPNKISRQLDRATDKEILTEKRKKLHKCARARALWPSREGRQSERRNIITLRYIIITCLTVAENTFSRNICVFRRNRSILPNAAEWQSAFRIRLSKCITLPAACRSAFLSKLDREAPCL